MTPRESFLVLRAVVRVLADSERTDEIHLVEELTGRERYRKVFVQLAALEQTRELMRHRPELSSRHVDYDRLRQLAPSTLGGAYVRHLDDHHLAADSQASPTRFVDDADLAYLMRRFRQTHDIWHVLLDLGVQGHEEVIVHAFSWGQLRLPVSALIVTFGSIKHLVLEARWQALRVALLDAYRLGRDAPSLLPVSWERMWEEPLDSVRQRYRVRPVRSS